MKKNILITSDCSLPRWDGIARFLQEIIPELARDFSVTVAVPQFLGSFRKVSGVKYVRFPVRKRKFGDIQFAGFNKKIIEDLVGKADVVFNQTIGPLGISAIRSASKLNKPIIHYVHSIDWELTSKSVKHGEKIVEFATKKLVKYLYNKCSLLLVPSRRVDDKLTQNKITTKKLLVPMGINTSWFSPPKSKSLAKESLNIHPETFVIGYVGRIAREKDLPTLYKAFSELKKLHEHSKLLLVGGGLTSVIPKDPAVIKPGPQSDVRKYFQAMDVYVLPSLTETSSLTTMEAMTCGLPVVVTPVGNIPEYVDDGSNGFLFARQDTMALTKRLNKLFSDKKLRDRLGRNARDTIVKKYAWKKTVVRIKKVFEKV